VRFYSPSPSPSLLVQVTVQLDEANTLVNITVPVDALLSVSGGRPTAQSNTIVAQQVSVGPKVSTPTAGAGMGTSTLPSIPTCGCSTDGTPAPCW
jgi:hypothetical protein